MARRDVEAEFYRGGAEESASVGLSDVDFERPKGSRTAKLFVALLVVAEGGAIYWLHEKLEGSERREAESEARASAAAQDLENAKKEISGLNAKVDQVSKENDDLRSSQQQLATEVKDKNEELSRLKSTYDALQDKMKKEIGSGDIKLTQGGGKLQVDFVDKILFDSGDATISKRGEEVLGRVGAVLATVKDRQIQVSGHTDNARITEKLTDKYPTNWELSAARAINVVRFLQEKAGVPEKILAVGAYGPHHPVASNTTPQGRARNRRIEIILTPTLQPIRTQAAAKPRLK